MTAEFDPHDIDLRAARFLIATTVAACGACGQPTLLAGICLPPGHERLEVDEDLPPGEQDEVWSAAERHVLLFHVDNLSDAARQRLQDLAPTYGFARDEEQGAQWANHCEHCGAVQDDARLFCEPDGAFLPTSEAGARRIRLVPVETPIGARAAGLADEPEFFDHMIRA